MAVIIDQHLTAVPDHIRLPRSQVELRQTLHSDLDGPEPAKITYSLDGRTAIFFETPAGLVKTVVVQADVPAAPRERRDTLTLVEEGDTAMAQIEIDQEIAAETQVFDSVTLEVRE